MDILLNIVPFGKLGVAALFLTFLLAILLIKKYEKVMLATFFLLIALFFVVGSIGNARKISENADVVSIIGKEQYQAAFIEGLKRCEPSRVIFQSETDFKDCAIYIMNKEAQDIMHTASRLPPLAKTAIFKDLAAIIVIDSNGSVKRTQNNVSLFEAARKVTELQSFVQMQR